MEKKRARAAAEAETVIRDICIDENDEKWITVEVEASCSVEELIHELHLSGTSIKGKKLTYLNTYNEEATVSS